ncbi:selenite/tellurite reduction operon protein ExtJ [Seleniivibrio woodruffii]|uniref:DUF5666 domain-containing protein n=1 Tax=Seleniivibrio woodruffii TaxID=1078050 RepID=A0A4R1KBT2_9BACT|nr:hypothetical protein [Seleniivibrio woodruffii]TCK61962.1 hypothetical protein C8D98_0470 [Seleniivibrio woodruffii]TVZ34921.1 hypothetical protein OF66_0522 [Seleniivibrio woodruffii]
MRKKIGIIVLAVMVISAGIAVAAAKASKGKVVSVDGTNITIKLDAAIDVKAGDAVKVEAVGGKPGFKLQGC